MLFPAPEGPRISITSLANDKRASMKAVSVCSRLGALDGLMRDGGGQADDEASPASACSLAFDRRILPISRTWSADAPGTAPIFGPDPTGMRFDDLARYRKPKTRILAEAIIGPVRVKALKDSLQRMSGDARTIVLNL